MTTRVALPEGIDVGSLTDAEAEHVARRALAGKALRGPADPRKESEKSLRARIVGRDGLATVFHWDHVGFRPAQTKYGYRTPGTGTMAKGWPDLTLVRARDHRLVFAELKGYHASGTRGKLSPDQVAVLETLRSLETRVWVAGTWTSTAEAAAGPTQVEVFAWWPDDWDQIVAVMR